MIFPHNRNLNFEVKIKGTKKSGIFSKRTRFYCSIGSLETAVVLLHPYDVQNSKLLNIFQTSL